MRKFWNRNEDAELEQRLRAARPVPPDTFLDELVSRVEATPAEMPVRTARRGGKPRFALAGVVTAAMVVMLAAFGGTSYATSGVSHVVHSTGHPFFVVFGHNNNEHHGGTFGKDKHHEAMHHIYPHPGFWCATKDSKVKIKLILTQERYDRLVARGFAVGPGPFASRSAAKLACPTAGDGHSEDDD